MKKQERKENANKGFSLVELIVVIAIMAVLVGVLAPQFLKYVERSRKSVDVQNVASIVTALQTYAADPMVETAKQIENGAKITITGTKTAVASGATGNCDKNADLALKAAGITEIGLKSGKWGAGSQTTIVLTVTVASDGSVTVAADTDGLANDILAGKYE